VARLASKHRSDVFKYIHPSLGYLFTFPEHASMKWTVCKYDLTKSIHLCFLCNVVCYWSYYWLGSLTTAVKVLGSISHVSSLPVGLLVYHDPSHLPHYDPFMSRESTGHAVNVFSCKRSDLVCRFEKSICI
jgi:hypothetical protein